MSLGEFVTFFLYLSMLMAPFRSLGVLVGQAQRAVAGGTRLFEVLDSVPEVREADAALPLPAGPGEVRLEGVTFAYPGRAAGARRHRPRRSRGPHDRHHRANRVGEDHPHPAHPPLLRRGRRERAAGRRRRAGPAPQRPAPRRGRGAPGPVPVLHQRAREHRLRAPRGHRRGGAARGADGSGRGFHRLASRRIRDHGGRARLHAVRGPAAAHRARPGAHHRPPGADPGRGHGLGGRLNRARDPGRPAGGHGGAHDDRDRAPALHALPGGRAGGAGGGARRRAGHPRRAATRPATSTARSTTAVWRGPT